jgi:NAD(P)-dependent dehydrogenase (short-subunit alcohol dehydrogenase family)
MILKGKRAIVTGGSRGIGNAIVSAYLREGAVVYSLSRKPADNQAALEEAAREAGGALHWRAVDMTKEEEVTRAIDAIVAEAGGVDILVNNAGITRDGLIFRMATADWDEVVKANLTSAFYTSRAVARAMIKQRSGSIINMSSAIADIGLARRVSYAASKGAVLAMTKSMQVDLAQYGIRVNALMPGTIMTPFVQRYIKESYKDPEEGYASIRKRQIGKELGQPEDVAWAALYLASDESRFVMASGLIVDGGVTGTK